MTDQSPSELERDAERVRAEIADTADQLKDKMSPGQLMDEVVGYFKDGNANQLVNNLKNQVRDNPLALALVGGGLAWLMMGSGPSASTGSSPRPNSLAGSGPAARPLAGSNTYGGAAATSHSSSTSSRASGIGSALSTGATGAKDAATTAAGKVSDAASSASDTVSATLHDIRDGASDGISRATQAGADIGSRAKSTFLDALEREPLVLGALGVAVGAAIGAMIPVSRTEREYLGEASAKARETASQALTEGLDKAKTVAKDVYGAARDEADNQGLMPGNKPVAAKLADVAKAAGSELKSAADHSVNEAGKKADEATNKLSPGGKPRV